MKEKLKELWEHVKKNLGWIVSGALLLFGIRSKLCNNNSRRLSEAKSELDNLGDEQSVTRTELGKLETEQSGVDAKLRDNETIIADSEHQLRESGDIIRESKEILEKYADQLNDK